MRVTKMTLVLFLAAANLAFSSDYRSGESIRINKGDTVSTDLFAGGRYVDILGYVAGDVFAGCQIVTVEGEIRDDLITAGQQTIVRGTIGDGVISFGQSIVIDGEVFGDVIAFSGIVRITDRAIIHGNLLVYSGEVFLDGGRVEGRLSGGCGKANLNGTVGLEVELETEKVSFGENYTAGGGTKLTLSRELPEDTENLPANLDFTVKERRIFFQKGFFYWSFFSMLIVGIILTSLFRNFSRDYLNIAEDNVAKSLGLGIVLLVATPVVVIVLAALFLTIPLALILAAVYLIFLYLSWIFASICVGKYTLELMHKENKANSIIWYLILGLLIVFLITKLPFLGWLVNLGVICFGLGSIILHIWHLRQNGNAKVA